jgi:hypothetical protein
LANGVLTAAWIQAVGTFLPTSILAGAAIYGLIGWRRQLLEQRRIERAEVCLTAADDVVKAIRSARSHVILGSEDVTDAGSMDNAVAAFEDHEIAKALDAFRVFHPAYRRASFFIEMPSPDTDRELGDCLNELIQALRMTRWWEKQGGRAVSRNSDNPEPPDWQARQNAAEHRGVFLGLPENTDPTKPLPVDPIELRIRASMNALEDTLLPIMGGRRRPRT